MKSFRTFANFETSVSNIFNAWLSSEGHSNMTGGEAKVSKTVGDTFEAWDGYISGKNLEIVHNKRIVQSWRTMEFNEEDADSTIELVFEENDGNCQILLTHSNIPEGQPDYKQGWEEHYFMPMRAYFVDAT